MSVLPSFAERKRVWVFRRCTLSLYFYGTWSKLDNSAQTGQLSKNLKLQLSDLQWLSAISYE